jgi:membrane-bound metal-dependent hydrolase YbcI (DUF457 family)
VYTGHFAIALTGAAGERRLPLWLLIAASFSGDLTEGAIALFGVRDPTRVWSHSLPSTACAGLFLGLGWMLGGGTRRGALILLLVAASHTGLDYVTGFKTLWPGQQPAGLLLYTKPFVDAAIELSMGVVAWFFWRLSLDPARRSRAPAILVLVVIAAVQVAALVVVLRFGLGMDAGDLSKFVR